MKAKVRPVIRVRRNIELVIRLDDNPQSLATLMQTLRTARTRLVACCSYREAQRFAVHVVAESAGTIEDALQSGGFVCEAKPVLVADTGTNPGEVESLGVRLGTAGIGIHRSYASQAPREGRMITVLTTTDNERAFRVLRQSPLARSA